MPMFPSIPFYSDIVLEINSFSAMRVVQGAPLKNTEKSLQRPNNFTLLCILEIPSPL